MILLVSKFYQYNQTKQNVDEDEKFLQPQNLSNLENFINIYNNDYKQFTEAINVSPTVSDPRLLSKDRAGNSGNYRIIFDNIDQYYLVPRADFRPEEYSYRTLKALFECIDYESSKSRRFTLIRPALVSKIDGNNWQLREMGCIQFKKA
jgi:hypothetical protein